MPVADSRQSAFAGNTVNTSETVKYTSGKPASATARSSQQRRALTLSRKIALTFLRRQKLR